MAGTTELRRFESWQGNHSNERNTLMRRVVVAIASIAVAAVVAAAFGSAAARADVFRQANLYTSGDICVDGISAAMDGPSGWGQGYGEIETSTTFPGLAFIPGMSCAWGLSRPPGYVAIG